MTALVSLVFIIVYRLGDEVDRHGLAVFGDLLREALIDCRQVAEVAGELEAGIDVVLVDVVLEPIEPGQVDLRDSHFPEKVEDDDERIVPDLVVLRHQIIVADGVGERLVERGDVGGGDDLRTAVLQFVEEEAVSLGVAQEDEIRIEVLRDEIDRQHDRVLFLDELEDAVPLSELGGPGAYEQQFAVPQGGPYLLQVIAVVLVLGDVFRIERFDILFVVLQFPFRVDPG